MSSASFPSLIQRFFTDRLLAQLGASPHTVAAYRDTFRMLFQFGAATLRRAPSDLRIEDLDVAFLGKFLPHLESKRRNCTRTRNNRLSAVRAFFPYVAITEPAFALQCQRILAIPSKRFERRSVEFLTEEESAALLEAPDTNTWIGRRDRALLLLAVQTGLRNSEIASLKRIRMSSLERALTSAVWARAASCVARHCGPTSRRFRSNGCRSKVGGPMIRSFPLRAVRR